MTIYGARRDRERFSPTGLLQLELKHGNYQTLYTVPHDPALFSVEAIPECMPHLASWAPVTVGRKDIIHKDEYISVCGKYLLNMTDEEIQLIQNQLAYLFLVHKVTGLDAYNECLTIHANINGADYSLTLTVLNKIELETESLEHLARRDSLN